MNMMTTLSPPARNRAVLHGLLRRTARADIEQAVDLLIAVLDAWDGDPDREDGIAEERGEACPSELSADASYPEWHRRGCHKLAAGGAEMAAGFTMHEDAEDDDGREVDDEPEDGDDGDPTWREAADQRVLFTGRHDDAEEDDPAERRRQPLSLNPAMAGNNA